ncbi:MAG: YlbF family regulator [candidate division KSB1 bacterium]|nr:YlbF family regulator [candidate division KSB1 bacterium]MDZ7303737.1 YlbF family regulator [candidate division KSB1 bacterium]MDZ7313126.1 YlbF family regulator [candidate division KSB1 bacterium]
MDIRLKLAAEEFARHLNSSQPVKEFHSAKEIFDHRPEIMQLRQEFTTRAQEFRRKQADHTLTQEDINEMMALQRRLNSHPITARYAEAQQAMVMMLQDCNMAMSEVLGFDFAATAAPAASC